MDLPKDYTHKHLEKRRKNNISATKSRNKAKLNIKEINNKIKKLEKENIILHNKIEELNIKKHILENIIIMHQTSDEY